MLELFQRNDEFTSEYPCDNTTAKYEIKSYVYICVFSTCWWLVQVSCNEEACLNCLQDDMVILELLIATG